MAMDMFAEDQYDISLATGVKADVDAFAAQLRQEQIQEMMSQPDGIIMCSELEAQPATVKCEDSLVRSEPQTTITIPSRSEHLNDAVSCTTGVHGLLQYGRVCSLPLYGQAPSSPST